MGVNEYHSAGKINRRQTVGSNGSIATEVLEKETREEYRFPRDAGGGLEQGIEGGGRERHGRARREMLNARSLLVGHEASLLSSYGFGGTVLGDGGKRGWAQRDGERRWAQLRAKNAKKCTYVNSI